MSFLSDILKGGTEGLFKGIGSLAKDIREAITDDIQAILKTINFYKNISFTKNKTYCVSDELVIPSYTSFTNGVPVKRLSPINSGSHKINLRGTPPTTDTYFDIYVVYSILPDGDIKP